MPSEPTTRCRSCQAPVWWSETPNGKRAPFDPDGTNHFVRCPDRRQWRKAEQPKQPQQDALFDAAEAPADRRRGYWEV